MNEHTKNRQARLHVGTVCTFEESLQLERGRCRVQTACSGPESGSGLDVDLAEIIMQNGNI